MKIRAIAATFGGMNLVLLAVAVILLQASSTETVGSETRVLEGRIAKRVYRQILEEVWAEVKPVYVEFGLQVRDRPDTFGALLAPLLSVRADVKKRSKKVNDSSPLKNPPFRRRLGADR